MQRIFIVFNIQFRHNAIYACNPKVTMDYFFSYVRKTLNTFSVTVEEKEKIRGGSEEKEKSAPHLHVGEGLRDAEIIR